MKEVPGRSAIKPNRPHAPYRFPDDPGIGLACPFCHSPLWRDSERLICKGEQCRKAYPVRDAIPVMVDSEATVLDAEEWRRLVS